MEIFLIYPKSLVRPLKPTTNLLNPIKKGCAVTNSYFDTHVHFGQFEDVYYSPHTVIETLAAHNVKGAYLSSTTSCMAWNDENEKEIIITHIKDEFEEAIQCAKKLKFKLYPVYWIIPKRHFENDTFFDIFSETPYQGLKIHPRAHDWNLKNEKICDLMDCACQFAKSRKIPIFIHTGYCEFELPEKFEEWYKNYPSVTFVLLHCKKTDSVRALFEKYANVLGDISFCTADMVDELVKAGFSERLYFGSDFPIMDYLYGKRDNGIGNLTKVYSDLLETWQSYRFTINMTHALKR